MVIDLHSCLFVMSHDSSDMSVGEIETALCTINPARCIVVYL